MKTICFIEARMRSTRLPGKVLKPILGKPMLELMVERLKRARTIDGIVIATTELPFDDPIVDLAHRLQIGVFRGSEEDVLARVLGAAKANQAEVIVETTGDCPLIDPSIVDKVVADFCIGGADFVSNALPYTTPWGTDANAFTTAALDEVSRITQDPADREHVSLYFKEHPEKYRIRNVTTDFPPEVAQLRLTVDTLEDFELIRQIYASLYPVNPEFSLADVLALLERRPELPLINNNVKQKSVR